MDWSVSRISMPVFDLEKSRQFYNFLFNNDNEDYSKNIIKSDECIIYGGDIELRLYKLKAELKSVDKPQSRRTFPTICIKNLDLAVKNLENNNISYFINKSKNQSSDYSIFIQEPGLNYLELIDFSSKGFIKNKYNSWNFHHINLECYDVRSSVDFISKNVKIKEGSWKAPKELGKVNINNNQLAIFNIDNNHSGIHINKADFTFSWRNNFIHNPTIGGHPAFNVSDIKGLINKLKKHDIPLTDAKVYAMPNIHQVYLFDPSANIIEINQNI